MKNILGALGLLGISAIPLVWMFSVTAQQALPRMNTPMVKHQIERITIDPVAKTAVIKLIWINASGFKIQDATISLIGEEYPANFVRDLTAAIEARLWYSGQGRPTVGDKEMK